MSEIVAIGDAPPESFVFVLNQLDFESELPCEVAPRCVLRRASDLEIRPIRQGLQWFSASISMRNTSYEHDVVATPKEDGTRYDYVSLPRNKWRYTVVAFEGAGADIYSLGQYANLLNPPLEFGFTCHAMKASDGTWVYGHGHNAGKLFSYFDSNERFGEKAKLMPKTELVMLSDLFTTAETLKTANSFVAKALVAFDQCRLLPDQSDAVALAYFGIIESLVTHLPEPKDTLDSIRRQLRNKMKLLRKRFVVPLRYEDYFDTSVLPNDEKIWNRLYDFRSRLAHGGSVDFSKEFKPLNEGRCVAKFLREVVRLLLIEGIKDESFLSDLRDC